MNEENPQLSNESENHLEEAMSKKAKSVRERLGLNRPPNQQEKEITNKLRKISVPVYKSFGDPVTKPLLEPDERVTRLHKDDLADLQTVIEVVRQAATDKLGLDGDNPRFRSLTFTEIIVGDPEQPDNCYRFTAIRTDGDNLIVKDNILQENKIFPIPIDYSDPNDYIEIDIGNITKIVRNTPEITRYQRSGGELHSGFGLRINLDEIENVFLVLPEENDNP